jgi:DNA-binding transcriptional regulator YiaG
MPGDDQLLFDGRLTMSIETSEPLPTTSVTADAIALLLEAEKNLRTARELVGLTIAARRRKLELSGAQLARIARANASELSKLERGTVTYTGGLPLRIDEALTQIENERATLALRFA